MTILKEFKEFALRGNMVDLAIGVIIGAAFGKVVSSFVDDIIMPPIGFLIGGIDFSKLSLHLGSVEIKYGVFTNNLISLLIISAVIFSVIKLMNALYRKDPTSKECPDCAMTIPIKAKKCCHCSHQF